MSIKKLKIICTKTLFLASLKRIDPQVMEQYWNPFPANPSEWGKEVSKIHHALIECSKADNRGPKGESLSRICKPFDYYLPKCNCSLEFDESQHFTLARAKSLILFVD
jgi:hypothetical protein